MLSRVHERGPAEIVTEEAFRELEVAMKGDECTTEAAARLAPNSAEIGSRNAP